MTPPAELLARFEKGEMVIVLDEHREVEGDFLVRGDRVTPEQLNVILNRARGLLCVACAPEVLDRLRVPMMCQELEDQHQTAFCVGVDEKFCLTGVSVDERARTVRVIASPTSSPDDFVRPGHVFPLRARDPRERWGHTECAVELAKKCGAAPIVTICEILNDAGGRASRNELIELSKMLGCAFGTLDELREFLV